MTLRRPIYFDGTDLVEFTTDQMTGLRKFARSAYAANPSVRLSVLADGDGGSSGGLIQMVNTNRIAGTQLTSSSSHPASPPNTSVNTNNINKLAIDTSQHAKSTIDLLTDSGNIGFPIYYDASAGDLRAMTDSDFIDTFIVPSIAEYDGNTSISNSESEGLYHISTSATDSEGPGTGNIIFGPIFKSDKMLANGIHIPYDSNTSVGDTLAAASVFSDEVPDVSLYTSGGIPEAVEQNTTTNYYLYYVKHNKTTIEDLVHSPGNGETFSHPQPINIPVFVKDGNVDLHSPDSDFFFSQLQIGMRFAAAHLPGSKLTYELQDSASGPGAARGTAITDTDVAGETRRTRTVNSNDYRAQFHPTGASSTVNTYQLRLLLK